MNKCLYKNKNWLEDQYINKKKSTYQIAKEYKYGIATIRRWLIKFDISRRTKSEAIHLAEANDCNITPKLLEIINGQLLGDANLCAYTQYSACFRWGQKHNEYIQYIKGTFANCGIDGGIIRKNKDRNNYRFQTCSYPEFYPLREKWYPSGKKIVPRDIELTRDTCLHWYLGDGGINNKKNRRSFITLATCCFPEKDVEFLVEKLKDLGFNAARQLYKNKIIIYISTYSTEDFLNYIGKKCPVECYNYRWNYQDNRTGPRRRSVLQYNLDGRFVNKFESICEATTTINSGNISLACAGKRKSAGGFIWKYASQN